jgi:hypothetical protein
MRGLVTVAVAWIFMGDVAYSEENVPDLKDPKMISSGTISFWKSSVRTVTGWTARAVSIWPDAISTPKAFSNRLPMAGRRAASACRRGAKC